MICRGICQGASNAAKGRISIGMSASCSALLIGTSLCDTLSCNAWQKGTVENTNMRARRWLPRKRNIRTMTDHDIKFICERLNNTPRNYLGWKTSAEVFRKKTLEEIGHSPYPKRQ